jgi:hypothetical protein
MELLRLLAVVGGYGRVLRHARREIDWWEATATGPLALEKMHRERRNVESATFFSMLAPASGRLDAMRRIVRFQLAYELLDGLSERAPTISESLRLHDVLHMAVGGPAVPCSGYVAELVLACHSVRGAFSVSMHGAIVRIGRAQALNHAGAQGRGRAGLAWWETAAAGISSLDVLAMLATPVDQHRAILDAYAEVRALSGLLDAVVDWPEDELTGNHNWLAHYPSMEAASWRLVELAELANERLGRLDQAAVHRALLAGLLAHNLVKAPEPFPRRLAPVVRYTRSATALFGTHRLLRD